MGSNLVVFVLFTFAVLALCISIDVRFFRYREYLSRAETTAIGIILGVIDVAILCSIILLWKALVIL